MAAIAFVGGAEVLLTTMTPLASTFCLIVLLLTLNSQANQPDRSFHPLSCLLGRFIYKFQTTLLATTHVPRV